MSRANSAESALSEQGLEMTFPDDAAVIREWANGGLVSSSALISQLRLWARYLEAQEPSDEGSREDPEMTKKEMERLMDLLGKLSEDQNVSGEMKDEISHIRDWLWNRT